MRRWLLALLLLAACGSSGRVPALEAARVDGVGEVLVTDQRQTLYVFAPDRAATVTCHDECAATWPPLVGSTASVGAGAQASLVGSAQDGGHRVVTYDGWPLYTYLPDRPGQATGQAIDLNGGYWYVIRADGSLVVPAGQTTPTR